MRRRKSRPQASLTATHSSTLAEEIVAVLRTLHSLSQWNSLINDYINAQLSSIGDIMTGCQSEAVRFTALSWFQFMLSQYNVFPLTLWVKLGIKTAFISEYLGGIFSRLRGSQSLQLDGSPGSDWWD